MFLFANLSEYNAEIDFEANYGSRYNSVDYVWLRLIPAIFSSFCSPMIYLTIRFSGFSKTAAFVASFFVAFDTSLLCEHRFILSDGMLHFFTCLFLVFWSHLNSVHLNDPMWKFWLIVTGLSLGAACSCKNTSWGLMVLIAFTQIVQVLSIVKKLDSMAISEIVYHGIILFCCFLIVFLLSFLVHFLLLPFDGQGTLYLPEEMQKQLIRKDKINSEILAKRLTTPNIYVRIISLVVNMHVGNMRITQFHPYQSRPIGWPLLTDAWVAFWCGPRVEVNCAGNVFVYYMGFFSLFAVLFAFKKRNYKWAIPFVVGWCVSYFPFYLIPRSMYLYHYHIPLIFCCCTAGIFLDLWLPPFWKQFIAVIMCLLVVIGFILWSPFAYGSFHMDRSIIIWNDNWMFGDKYHRELQAKNR
jgi:dolichyl-phosphate-mannose--protein O-mannosyl transferase